MSQGTLFTNARLVDRDIDCPGSVMVRDGLIEAVFLGDSAALQSGSGAINIVDLGGKVLMPAFVDLHAHFRDPGQEYKEDLESASRAAAAGGYGTVVLMANTNPVISDSDAAVRVRERSAAIGLVDAFQAVSLTRDFNGSDTSALASLDPAHVPVATEDGREVASAAVMLEAMRTCAVTGVIVSCHCEDPALAASARPFREAALRADAESGFPAFADRGRRGSSDFSGSGDSVPQAVRKNLAEAERLLRLAEDTMTVRNLTLAAETGCRVHIAHISTVGSLNALRHARSALLHGGGLPSITCEVTPHHLALTDTVPAIVNPPLRSRADRDALIEGIIDGTIDAIATDHAPHSLADKAAGAPGFSGIQTAFSSCYTVLVKTGRIGLSRLSALMAARPAEILGVARGLLRPGYAADLTLIDPDGEWTVEPNDSSRWFSKSINTPFCGSVLSGKVLSTWHRGRKV